MARERSLVKIESGEMKDNNFQIRLLNKTDIPPIAEAFSKLGWDKPESQYEQYLVEQENLERVILIATLEKVFIGYLTIVWESPYPHFWQEGIPEIVDFNVLPQYRKMGTGTRLMDAAEMRIGERSPMVGIGVGLTADYGAAQILYVSRGYIPDGRGLIKNGQSLEHGDIITIDDNLTLYFTKIL
jgi:GNAT superfamily N-acetyltransferase